MAIRSILVSYLGTGGGESAADGRADRATARRPHDWRGLEGAEPASQPRRVVPDARDRPGPDEAEAEFAETRRAGFMRGIADCGLAERADFVVLSGGRAGGLAEYARPHDVVVIGGVRAGSRAECFSVRPDVVALRSGGPVIIVPHDYTAEGLTESGVLAWDGKRASALRWRAQSTSLASAAASRC